MNLMNVLAEVIVNLHIHETELTIFDSTKRRINDILTFYEKRGRWKVETLTESEFMHMR